MLEKIDVEKLKALRDLFGSPVVGAFAIGYVCFMIARWAIRDELPNFDVPAMMSGAAAASVTSLIIRRRDRLKRRALAEARKRKSV